jgi:hypothetical protein
MLLSNPFMTWVPPHCRESVDHCFATACWPISHMEAQLCHLPSWDWIWCHLASTHVWAQRFVWWSSIDLPSLIKFDQILVGRMPTATVWQCKDENPNVALIHISLITGTPVHPKLIFSVNLLKLFYHLCHWQPSIGVQGFIKAICAF